MDKKNRFLSVIKANRGLIAKVATLYTNSTPDKEDLFQEIVYQLWKSFDTYSEQAAISTWMYRIAMNTAIYNLKREKRRVSTTPINGDAIWIANASDNAEERQVKLLYASIHRLDLLDRGIILLYLDGKKHQEIAEIIGITTSNVGTRISRIKEKLKLQLINQI